MDEHRPVMDTLTPELEPRRDVVAVTLRMPDGATAGYLQSFATSAHAVLERLGMGGIGVEATSCLLRVWVTVVGAEDGEAAVVEAVRRVEGPAGGYMVVDGAERGELPFL
jgi:hypothetical protein